MLTKAHKDTIKAAVLIAICGVLLYGSMWRVERMTIQHIMQPTDGDTTFVRTDS